MFSDSNFASDPPDLYKNETKTDISKIKSNLYVL